MSLSNIIPNAKNKFNQLLSSLVNSENILQYYDNVTYNIRFYMLSNTFQKIISTLREKNLFSSYSVPDNEKIIIAESGVSAKYSIESLSIDTIYSNATVSNAATSYSLQLQIKEVNRCQLINQIVVISKLLGYESYILQPYHIDIWFSGFDNATHKPIQIIPEIGILSYEVILNEVKTNIDVSGTHYNFSCTCAGINSTPKEVMAIGDIGGFSDYNGLLLTTFRDRLVKTINTNYFNKNQKLKKYYPDNKYINIRLIDIDKIDESFDISTYSEDYCSKSLMSVKLLNSIYGDSNDKKEDSGIHPKSNNTLSDIFQTFCLNTSELKDYFAKPIFKIKYIDNAEGLQIGKIQMDVLFSKNTYLEYYNNRFINNNENHTRDELEQYEYSMMYNHLKSILSKKLLVKKYEWLFNGHDTSVLEVNSSVDKLWISNIPRWDIVESIANNTNSYLRFYNDEMKKLLENFSEITTKDELNNIAHKSNYIINGVRTMANDKRLYIDDIYNCVNDNLKSKYLNSRAICEKNNPYSPVYPDETSDSNNESIVAKTGYYNIFATGNLLKLNIKILGDPYWLQLFSDSYIYENKYDQIGNMHYFLFKMNTTLDQKENGTYDLENVVDFCNIYQIIKSKSLFENGKFTQDLEAIISPEFLTLGRLEI